MKAYVITTGTVFGLLTLAHIARGFLEGSRMATDPVFVIFTLAAAAFWIWSVSLLWLSSRASVGDTDSR